MSGIADGSQLNGPLVVFLVVLGAAATVTAGYSIHKLYARRVGDDSDAVFDGPSKEQVDYMRQVRMRNMMWNINEARGGPEVESRGSG